MNTTTMFCQQHTVNEAVWHGTGRMQMQKWEKIRLD